MKHIFTRVFLAVALFLGATASPVFDHTSAEAAALQYRFAYSWKGTWSSSTRYAKDDLAYYDGSTYKAKIANSAQIPTASTTYWEIFASKGGSFSLSSLGIYSVKDYGALGDSTGTGTGTNDASAIQSAIDAAPAGSTVYFPPGRYRINSQITWSGKRLFLLGFGRASIVEGTALTATGASGALIYVNGGGCNSTTISGLNFEGAETEAGFSGTDTKEYCAIRGNTVTDITIDDCKVTAKSWGVILDECVAPRVVDLTFTGLLTASGATGQNYSSAVRVKGGERGIVRGLVAKNMGSGLLSGTSSTTPSRWTIENCMVENAWDNGIYVSSGEDFLVTGVSVKGSAGTGVKVRGSQHRVIGCHTYDTQVGILVSGHAASADAYGANSHGVVVANNVIEKTTRDGIGLDTVNYPTRHAQILGNYLRNIATDGGTYAGVRADGNYYQIQRNVFEDCNGTTAAIIAGGTVGVPAIGLDVSHNQVFDSSGEGMRLQYLQSSIVSHNLFRTIASDAVQLRNSTNNMIAHNQAVTGVTGDLVDATAANSNTGNFVINNAGGTLNVDLANNLVAAVTDHGVAYGAAAAASAVATFGTAATPWTITVPGAGANSERFGASAATSTGTGATAVGKSATASGNNSAAFGYNAAAAGLNGTAAGQGATASATNTAALGQGATASGTQSTALGAGASATQTNTVAVGMNAAAATNTEATAIGMGATASGASSTAIGKGATASQTKSIALGAGAACAASGRFEAGASADQIDWYAWGDFIVGTAGKGLKVKEGSNARMGTVTLVAGAATVSNTSVTANTRVFAFSNTDGGTPGWLRCSARVVGTSFTITSSNGADTSDVAWILFEPTP